MSIAGIGLATVTDLTQVVGIPIAIPDDIDTDNELPPFPLVLLGRNKTTRRTWVRSPAWLGPAPTGSPVTISKRRLGRSRQCGLGFNTDCCPGPEPCIGTSLGLRNFTHNLETGRTFTATVEDVPEPATMALMGVGLAAFVRRSRRGRG